MLTNDKIIELAKKPGVKQIAVENFLITVDHNIDKMSAELNLEMDAKSYGWNQATISAIKEGIRLWDTN